MVITYICLYIIYIYIIYIYIFVDKQRYLRIYQEQLQNQESLKVNIIQCITVGPPNVGKTRLKEQLLANHEENPSIVEKRHDQSPSSPICENVKKTEVIPNNKKSRQSPLTIAVENYTWKTLTFDEEVIDYLKAIAKNKPKYLIVEDPFFWLILFSLNIALIFYGASILDDEEVEKLTQPAHISIDPYILVTVLVTVITFSFIFTFLGVFFIFRSLLKKKSTRIPLHPDDIVKEVLQHYNVESVQPHFDQSYTIYFRDCGGLQSSMKFFLLWYLNPLCSYLSSTLVKVLTLNMKSLLKLVMMKYLIHM